MDEFNNITVCLVEDDKMIREMYQTALELDGFKVLAAADGAEGLMLMKKNRPDIAIIDIMMPIMSGITLMQKMDEDPDLRNIPVIVSSNNNDKTVMEQTKKSRFYLLKAFYTPKKVVGVVREVLSRNTGF